MSLGPFLCYRELIPSTSVLCSAFFRTDGVDYLITSSSTSLNVYEVRLACESKTQSSLHPVATFDIYGYPHDICCVEISSSLTSKEKVQHLLISLDKGKLVLVLFDAVFKSLKVIKMFNAEDGAIGDSACPRSITTSRLVYPGLGSSPHLAVDCLTRAACMSITSYDLLLLSYRSQSSLENTFSVHIPSLGLPGAIIDFCFINGYGHPTLAILQDTLSLPIGHLTKVGHTVTLTVFAVNIASQSCVPLWQQKQLPHDCCRILPMNSCYAIPAGVLVITMNAVLIATQESIQGLACNGFARTSVDSHIPLVPWPLSCGVELHASKWQEISPGVFVSSLADGNLLLFHVESIVENAVYGEGKLFYDVDIIGKSVESNCFSVLKLPSCTVTKNSLHLEQMVWFFGSAVADCLLLDVKMSLTPTRHGNSSDSLFRDMDIVNLDSVYADNSSVDVSDASIASTAIPSLTRGISVASSDVPPSKRIRNSLTSESSHIDSNSSVAESIMRKIIQEENNFYGNKVADLRSNGVWKFPNFMINLADSVVVLGPILSGNFFSGNEESLCSSKSITWDRSVTDGGSKGKISAAAYITDREARDTLAISSGLLGQSSLLRISNGIHLSKLAARNFTHVTHSCTLPYDYTTENGVKCSGTYFFLSEIHGVTGNRNRRFGSAGNAVTENSKIILASDKTVSNGEVVVQMTELHGDTNAFCTEQQTASVGLICPDIAVQCCSQCLRVVQFVPVVDTEASDMYSVELLALQDVVMEEDVDMGGFGGKSDEYVVTADCCLSGWVIVLSSLHILYLFKYDAADEILMLQHTIYSSYSFDSVSGLLIPITNVDDLTSSAKQEGIIVTASLFCGDIPLKVVDPRLNNEAEECKVSESPNEDIDKRKREEEVFFYGEPLRDLDKEEGTSGVESTIDGKSLLMDQFDSHKADCANDFSSTPEQCYRNSYVVLADRSGRVSFIQISSEVYTDNGYVINENSSGDSGENYIFPRKVFQSVPLGGLVDMVPLGIDKHPDISTSQTSPPLPPPRRYVTAVLLTQVGSDESTSISDVPLCLCVVCNSGDIVVYKAITELVYENPRRVPQINCFRKLGHSIITRRKKNRSMNRLKNIIGNNSNFGVEQSYDLGSISTSQAMLCRAKDSRGMPAIIIGGTRPLLVCSNRGMVQVLPLCLPELPYAGVGVHISNFFATCSSKGFSVLWREDKIDSLMQDSFSISSQATLTLYTESEGTMQIPGSTTSIMRTCIGRTTHKVCEILQNQTDDTTQKALLKSKTFAMLCSDKIVNNWSGKIFTDEEKAEEEGTYDRFFKGMQSFSDPENDLGPPPILEDDLFSICIMQAGGSVVDKFPLPKGERVLDMTVVYLNVAVPDASIPILDMALPETMKRKAFVVVCTSIDDKHGEDTQGEGRLLFLSLDYALYQEDQDHALAQDQSESQDEGQQINSKEDQESQMDFEQHEEVSGEIVEVSEAKSDNHDESQENNSSSDKPAISSAAQERFLGAIKPKLRLLWTGPGPGSVVTQFKEKYILATVGATLYLYILNAETMELEQVAFFFAQFFISSICVMKDYILIGDAYESVQFVAWREEDMSLTLLAKDYDRSACVAANYVLDGNTLGFLVSDDEANIQLMRFNPKVIESKKGFRLLNVADFHLGSSSTALISHKCLDSPFRLLSSLPPSKTLPPPPKPPPPPPPPVEGRGRSSHPPPPPRPPPPAAPPPPASRRSLSSSAAAVSALALGARYDKNCSNKSCLIVGTADGGLGILSPIDEGMHRTLALLQQIMSTTVPTCCGLNPRQFRQLKCSRQRLEKTRSILDGNLLWQYANLEGSLQDELAFAMGTTADIILDYLLEIDMFNSFF